MKKKTPKKTGKKAAKSAAKKVAKKPPAKKSPARKRSASAGTKKSAKPRKPRPISEMPLDGWTLRLYVAGDTPKSNAARENLKRLCEKHLPGKCTIEVIDLVEHPELARADQVLAIPTLVRRIPVPIKRIIGDLSNEERAMLALDLRNL